MSIRLTGWEQITIDGTVYDHDVVIHSGTVSKRDKTASKPLKSMYGHTPLSVGEKIPWDGPVLVVGTGHNGALPVTPEVFEEAKRRGVQVQAVPTTEACTILEGLPVTQRNAVLHTTC